MTNLPAPTRLPRPIAQHIVEHAIRGTPEYIAAQRVLLADDDDAPVLTDIRAVGRWG